MQIEIKKIKDSQVEITGEIPADEFENAYKKALDSFGKDANIPGFRAGHAPEKTIIEKVGEEAVLEKAADTVLSETLPKAFDEHKLFVIGRPQISITKIARNNPLGFKATVPVLPEISLPDYKKIAGAVYADKKEEIDITEEEIKSSLDYLQKTVAHQSEQSKQPADANKNKEENHEHNHAETSENKPDLPELDDEFAKKLGQPDMDSLKQVLKTNIAEDKKRQAKEKRRMEALEKISGSTKIEIPESVVESEKEKMLSELKSSIANMGLEWNKYLEHIKKTEEELRKEWSGEAEKRVKYGLILREIGEKENIKPTNEEVDKYADNMLTKYPAEEQGKIDKENIKNYAYGIIRNEKVFELLENANQTAGQ